MTYVCALCRYPQHEEEVGEMARKVGFSQVSISSQVMPMVRIVPRGYTGELHKLCMYMCPFT